MTPEEKELLLKDLCCRLPYGVMVHAEHDWFEDDWYVDDWNEAEVPPYDELLTVECHSILNNFSENPLTCCFIIKPYLRPMSSMTEEEKIVFYNEIREHWDGRGVELSAQGSDGVIVSPKFMFKNITFFIERHFDINDLIPKGLALEAPKDMYK